MPPLAPANASRSNDQLHKSRVYARVAKKRVRFLIAVYVDLNNLAGIQWECLRDDGAQCHASFLASSSCSRPARRARAMGPNGPSPTCPIPCAVLPRAHVARRVGTPLRARSPRSCACHVGPRHIRRLGRSRSPPQAYVTVHRTDAVCCAGALRARASGVDAGGVSFAHCCIVDHRTLVPGVAAPRRCATAALGCAAQPVALAGAWRS